MVTDDLCAEIVLRSQRGAAILKELGNLTPERIHLFQASEDAPSKAAEVLERAGFRVLARSRFGVSIAGPKNLFERYFNTSVVERSVQMLIADRQVEAPVPVMEMTPTVPSELQSMTESVYIPERGYFLARRRDNAETGILRAPPAR